MDKFLIRRKVSTPNVESSSSIPSVNVGASNESDVRDDVVGKKRARVESSRDSTCEFSIISDPALRKAINDYEPRVRDVVKREYVVQGACQPLSHDFPRSMQGNKQRAFLPKWFKEYEWLEYSVSKDAAFCFWCYLFQGVVGKRFGDDVFVATGFRNWKKGPERFKEHVGSLNSTHNNARRHFFAYKDQRQSVSRCLSVGKEVLDVEYRIRLTASVDVVRLLLVQGLAFRGHDEAMESPNRGNFLEILNWYSSRNVEVGKVCLQNAPLNHQLTSPSIQKEIVSACATVTTKAIISDIGDKFFSLLIDEARDSSIKEQMAIVVRYVNNLGLVVERFLGVVHVADTTALSLKRGIDEFFAKHELSISKVRGQGYDGASNMRGEFNGLKALILKENPCAWYVHCFAHQLQLVIVVVSQKNQFVSDFFEYLCAITNMVGASCKRKDEFRQRQHEEMVERLETGNITTGRGKNQESTLARPGSTRWGSHYITIVRILSLWNSTLKVLDNIFDEGTDEKTRGTAGSLAEKMENYGFVFIAHLMNKVLAVTSMLSQCLQQKEQNIIVAVGLLQSCKLKFQDMRENGWDPLIREVNDFCTKHNVVILDMDHLATDRRSRRNGNGTTNYHHLKVEIFCQVIDQVVTEMENRFSESTTELLTCIACLDPKNVFSNFNVEKLLQLAKLYPQDFSICDQTELLEQLELWIVEMRRDENYSKMQSIGDIAKKMVESGYQKVFHLVYRLIELILVLPVATTTVERAFSAMSIVKTDLRNKMGDEYLTDSLVCYIEKEIFKSIDNEVIIQYFQMMRSRKRDLPPLM